jgi:hypothetical protein
MNNSHHPEPGLSRRDLLKGTAAAGLVFTAGSPKASASTPGFNAIQMENAKPGTQDWLLTNTLTDPTPIPGVVGTSGRSTTIEGYCSANSIRAGESLKIMVSTNPASAFDLEIYRTGYYNGDGARLVRTYSGLTGTAQPDPPIGGDYVRECQWTPAVDFVIPNDWLSGVYLGKLTAAVSGIQSYVIFIVRDDRPCDLLFQCSDMTWSAYNRWPTNYSIYTKHDGRAGTDAPSSPL